MLALEPLRGWRVVASARALDALDAAGALPLRIASDELLLVDRASSPSTGGRPTIDDPNAIVEPESAFLGAWLAADDFDRQVRPLVEWAMPDAQPWLGQGLVVNVPVKLWLEPDGRVLIVVSRGLAHELQERLA